MGARLPGSRGRGARRGSVRAGIGLARRHDPLDYHLVVVALSEARAARRILNDLPNWGQLDGETADSLRNWATDALGRTLDQAETDFRAMLGRIAEALGVSVTELLAKPASRLMALDGGKA
jgi:hypothetical protein